MMRRGTSESRTVTVAVFLVVVGFTAITLHDLLSADRLPAYRDLVSFFVPFKHFLAESLRRGDLPLWNPFIYMGTPFLAGLQSGVFYPPSVVLLLPFPLGFNLFLFVHFLIALGGFWVFARDRDLPPAASAVGTLTFVLGGYLVSTINVTNNLQAAVWAPWVLVFWTRYAKTRSRHQLFLAAAMFAVELLGGAPEVLLLTLTIAAAWTAYVTMRRPVDGVRLGIALGVLLLIAAGLTAFQTLPTREYIGFSARISALPLDEVTTWSLQPVSLLQLLLPHSASLDSNIGINVRELSLESLEPWIRSIYLGLIPLCLAISGAFSARERWLWGALVVAGAVFALGRNTAVLPSLYHALPQLFGKFRYPEKFIFLVHLSVSVLVAEGAAAWIRCDRRAERAGASAAVVFIVLAVALVSVRSHWPGTYLDVVAHLTGRFVAMEAYVPLAATLVFKAQRIPLILGSFLALLVFRRMSVVRPQIVSAALPLLVGADLGSIHYDLNSSISWSLLRDQRPFVDVDTLRRTHQRVFLYQTVAAPLPDLVPQPIEGLEVWSRVIVQAHSAEEALINLWRVQYLNIPVFDAVDTLSGADGIARSSDDSFRNALAIVPRALAVKLVRVFGAGYLVGPVPLAVDGLEPIPRTQPFFAYRVKNPVPAVRLVSRLIEAPTELAALNTLLKDTFRPESDAVVERLPAGWQDGANEVGEAEMTSWAAERIAVRVHARSRAFLVLHDSFFPGWEARVDGVTVPIHRTDAFVRGVVVEPGDHVVVFAYRSWPFLIGAGISIVTLVGIVVSVLMGFPERR